MKMPRSTVALVLIYLAGCGSCEHPAQPPATGGGGTASTPTVMQPATTPPAEGAPAATQAGAPTTPAAQGGAATAPAMPPAAGADEDGDCIVIGDASPDYGAPPLEVEFSAEAECSTGQPTYRWDFGDGSSSADPNATHTYAKAGEFTAVVTVTGADGSKSTDEIDITVEEDAAEME